MKYRKVYLDNAASTFLNPKVLRMLRSVKSLQGNPQGMNGASLANFHKLQWARFQVAQAIGCDEDEIFFCSGATEANNFAKKLWKLRSDDKVHDSLITNKIQRVTLSKKEMDRINALAEETIAGAYGDGNKRRMALGMDYALVQEQVNNITQGNKKVLKKDVDEKDIVVAVNYYNNETGDFDLSRYMNSVGYTRIYYSDNRLFLDLTATIGHTPIDLHKMESVVGASFSGHKFGGLQGCGVLYIKSSEQRKIRKNLLPKSPWSLNGGTPNTLGIYSLGIAIKDACNDKKIAKQNKKIKRMILYIKDKCDKLDLKVSYNRHIINITFKTLGAMSAVSIFRGYGIDISAGSACHSDSTEPSKVLIANGYSTDEALNTVRISLSNFNTWSDIKFFVKILQKVIANYDYL